MSDWIGITRQIRIRRRVTTTWHITLNAIRCFIADHCITHGAALAFYALFSFAPMVLIATAVAAIIFGEEAARQELLSLVEAQTGERVAVFAGEVLDSAVRSSGSVTLLGAATMLVAATAAFAQLERSLDAVFGFIPRSKVWSMARKRLMGLVFAFLGGAVLVVSLVLGATLATVYAVIARMLPWVKATGFMRISNQTVFIAVLTVLLVLVLRFVPNGRIKWRDAVLGSLVAAILFSLGRTVLVRLLAASMVTPAYGAAGSLVIALIWVYYSAQVLLFGAELAKVGGWWRELSPASKRLTPTHPDVTRHRGPIDDLDD